MIFLIRHVVGLEHLYAALPYLVCVEHKSDTAGAATAATLSTDEASTEEILGARAATAFSATMRSAAAAMASSVECCNAASLALDSSRSKSTTSKRTSGSGMSPRM